MVIGRSGDPPPRSSHNQASRCEKLEIKPFLAIGFYLGGEGDFGRHVKIFHLRTLLSFTLIRTCLFLNKKKS